MSAVRLVILHVNVACVLVLGDWAVEDVVAVPLLDTAEVQAMVEGKVHDNNKLELHTKSTIAAYIKCSDYSSFILLSLKDSYCSLMEFGNG